MSADPNWDVTKVRAFGERLLTTPADAVKLAKNLLWDGDAYAEAAVVMNDFHALTRWEQAGVIDELRDALDKQLQDVFQRYVRAARGNE